MMRKIILFGVFFFIIGCNTIKNKTDELGIDDIELSEEPVPEG